MDRIYDVESGVSSSFKQERDVDRQRAEDGRAGVTNNKRVRERL